MSDGQSAAPRVRTQQERLAQLRDRKREALQGGGTEKIAKLHEQGKLHARERLEVLLDPNSFVEFDMFVTAARDTPGVQRVFGDGVVTGSGTIDGRLVFVYAQDFTVMGGSLGERHAQKITKMQDYALRNGAPIIGINDSGGARIQEGVVSLGGYTDIFYRNVQASGVIPQIAAIMGPCAGGAVYSPALMDFIFMVKKSSHMFLTGPNVIKEVLNEDVTFEELGGATTHSQRTGCAHFAANDEIECLNAIRHLISFLPSNNMEEPPFRPTDDPRDRRDPILASIIPDEPNKPYDMKDVIRAVVDDGEFFEVQPLWAANIVIGFAHLGGHVVGLVANQPKVLAGVLDIDSSDKGARFIRFCDAFNIPIVTFEDVPGFLPGKNQEWGGIIRHGAKLLYAYCEATVPKLTVITRKSYGGAYCVMGSKHMHSDLNLAWQSAEVAVMGSKGAVNIIYRNEIAKSKNPEKTRNEFVADYEEQFSNPYIAAERGFVDDVIEPAETRERLIQGLEMFRNKREVAPPKKHGNVPM
ncbi:MAG TPA: acyl-CoA carboxylase subunit beta [bacterium]|nr:acyl-CoA carboxylase subunit beta [bacterium]